MNKRILSTCLSFNLDDDIEKTCYYVLTSLGSYAKLFVSTMIYVSFSSSVTYVRTKDGRTGIQANSAVLTDLIEKYKKDYVLKKGVNVIFLNWNPKNDIDMDCLKILSLFGGGEKGFIMHLLRQCYPFFFYTESTLPQYKKISRKGNTRKEIPIGNQPSISGPDITNEPEIDDIGNFSDQETDTPVKITAEEELELMDIITKGFES